MSTAWTFEMAAKAWRHGPALCDATLGGVGLANQSVREIERSERFLSAECFLLEHAIRTADEAELVIDVLIDQRGDGRSDGRDLDALRNLKRYVGGAIDTRPFRLAGLDLEVR